MCVWCGSGSELESALRGWVFSGLQGEDLVEAITGAICGMLEAGVIGDGQAKATPTVRRRARQAPTAHRRAYKIEWQRQARARANAAREDTREDTPEDTPEDTEDTLEDTLEDTRQGTWPQLLASMPEAFEAKAKNDDGLACAVAPSRERAEPLQIITTTGIEVLSPKPPQKYSRRSDVATRLPSDWMPNERGIAAGMRYGFLSAAGVMEFVPDFIDQHFDAFGRKGLSRDWDATFCNWITKLARRRFAQRRDSRCVVMEEIEREARSHAH